MAYARRYIDVTVSKAGSGSITFGGRGDRALRIHARILKAGGFNLGQAQLTLYGLSQSHINDLSTFGTRYRLNYNYDVTVEAGDEENGTSVVFQGAIRQAWANLQQPPQVPFQILAISGAKASTMRADPSSYQGSSDVPTMLQKLAGTAGLQFENNGVTTKLDNPYFWGSPWEQIKQIIDAARIDGFIDDNTLSIWPPNGNRAGGNLKVDKWNGMRMSPSFTEYGIQTVVEFTRSIKYGTIMDVTSEILPPASGSWRIIRIDYDLQSNTPNGNWYAILDGSKIGAPIQVT